MHWMCFLYEGEPTTAGNGCAGPGWGGRGGLPADPCVEAAHRWTQPHRHCRTGVHSRTCYCDEALRRGVAA
jgi:hypothetical protein